MKYIKVKWIHKKGEEKEPIWLYSEINKNRWEVRRVDVYKNGQHKSYFQEDLLKKSLLGLEKYPQLDFINTQINFEATEISKNEFEAVWKKAT